MSATDRRPFRFGALLGRADSRDAWIDLARRAEGAGYGSLFIPDHIHSQLGPVAALMSVADATSLRVGTLVLCNDLRNPVVLAKEAATIDLLSEGRLELGIGAGWLIDDYTHTGIAMSSPGERVDRLEEAVSVLKGLFSGEEFTFAGVHYRVGPMRGTPRPVQAPHPPLLIGGSGRRVLGLAAREAQIVGISPNLRSGRADPASIGPKRTHAAIAASVERLRAAAGERLAELELNVAVVDAAITDHPRRQADEVAGRLGMTPDEVLASPQVLIGTVAQVAHKIERLRDEFGFSYVVVAERGWQALAPVVERLSGR